MERDSRLVASLFEALAEPDWADAFLVGVCSVTRSPAAAVLEVDIATRKQHLPAYFGQGREMAEAFERTHAAENPWRPADESKGPPAGSVVVPDDVLPYSMLRRTAFWSDFLRPMQVDHGGGLIGLRDSRRIISLTLLRSAKVGPYDAQERTWLRGIAPHWVNACNLRNRLSAVQVQSRTATAVLDRMGTAAFLLDRQARCFQCNAAGDELLRSGTVVRLLDGHLIAAHPAGHGADLGSVSRTLRAPDGRVIGHAAAHPLPGHEAVDGAYAVVFVETVEMPRSVSLRYALQTTFGLTPREAEVAEGLADGLTLAAVAQRMKITTGAARTRIKVVYSKTGTTHQAALVALVRSVRVAVGG